MFRFAYDFSQNPSPVLKLSLLRLRFVLLLFKTVFVFSDLLVLAGISSAPAQTCLLALRLLLVCLQQFCSRRLQPENDQSLNGEWAKQGWPRKRSDCFVYLWSVNTEQRLIWPSWIWPTCYNGVEMWIISVQSPVYMSVSNNIMFYHLVKYCSKIQIWSKHLHKSSYKNRCKSFIVSYSVLTNPLIKTN